jgi:carbonic anhydrase
MIGPLINPKIQNNAKLQMSLFANTGKWGGACSGANQSPINLSQSIAKPCDILCDLVMDDGYVSDAHVYVTREGLVLASQSLGTCKFNGAGYSCEALIVNHPSHHTIENIQADAEVTALFRNPTGKRLFVHSLVRVNPTQTDSSHFLNAFVPYANPSQPTHLKLNNWTLSMMVPPNATYYTYQGSLPVPGCESGQTVVFSSMINIDSNDFALLVKNVQAGSRPIQPLGNREIFFNSGEQLPGGNMPKDGKVYMRLHPRKEDEKKLKKGDVRPLHQADISGPQQAANNNAGIFGAISDWSRSQAAANGWFSIVNLFLLMISLGCAIYFAYMYSDQLAALLTLNEKGRGVGRWLRSFVVSTGGAVSARASTFYAPGYFQETPSGRESRSNSLDRGVGSRSLIPHKNDPLTAAVGSTPSRDTGLALSRQSSSRSLIPKDTKPVEKTVAEMTPSTPLDIVPTEKMKFAPMQSRNTTPKSLKSVTSRASEDRPLPTLPSLPNFSSESSKKSFGPTRPRSKSATSSIGSTTSKSSELSKSRSNRKTSFGPSKTRR